MQRAPASSTPMADVLHPFQKAREYKRALNSAKLEKVFAKPFLDSMGQHSDGITVMAKNKFDYDNSIGITHPFVDKEGREFYAVATPKRVNFKEVHETYDLEG